MSKYISGFVNRVCGEIKYKNIHESISIELEGHIYELMDGYIEDGMSEGEAAKKAVEQMGDPIQIGKELSKTHKPKTEWSIILLIGALVLIGGMALFSIASDNSWSFYSDNAYFLKTYTIYTLIGIVVGTGCYFFDYTKLEKYSLYIFIGTIVFSFVSAKSSYTIHGAPYIRIVGYSVAPISIAMPFFLISFGGLVKRWATGSIKDMIKLLVLSLLSVIACYSQPSLASALLLMGGFGIIIAMAIMSKEFRGNSKRFLLGIYGGGTLSIFLLVMNMIAGSAYKKARLLAFLNLSIDPDGAGYIYTIIRKILSGAKLFGRGENLYFDYNGVSRIALPEANTDFIFTYIVSTFGWIVGITTVIIISVTIVRMSLATRKINDQYGRYLASSIVSVFALQSLGNILMNVGIFPLTSFSLPLISYGGTNFIFNMALIGLMLGIYRRKDLWVVTEKSPQDKNIGAI